MYHECAYRRIFLGRIFLESEFSGANILWLNFPVSNFRYSTFIYREVTIYGEKFNDHGVGQGRGLLWVELSASLNLDDFPLGVIHKSRGQNLEYF